jgi:amino acid efflux transporter
MAASGKPWSIASSSTAARDGRSPRTRTITLAQAVALYVGAVVGAGVLVLPGVAAGRAGPASLLAWGFDGFLGIPIALTFAALAARFPDAGGVSVFAARAFGSVVGAIVGWFYFFAAAAAQALVTLTGAHYAADALGWGRGETYGLAAVTLLIAVVANLRGLRVSARLQLALAAAIAAVLVAATLAAIPHERAAHLTPFLTDGWQSVGRAAFTLFFAFFGWEAITHLSAEFRDPARDVPRATIMSVFLVTALYLGVAFSVVATGTYGSPALDRVAVAHVLSGSLGVSARVIAPSAALVITLGTANAFVAATSRLGYALGRDGAFPRWMSRHNGDVPATSIVAVAVIAGGGLALGYLRGWGADSFLVVPNSLVIVVYIVGMLAGVRLLRGRGRLLAAVATVLCVALLPFVGVSLALPFGVAAAALLYRWSGRRLGPGNGDRRQRTRRVGTSSRLTSHVSDDIPQAMPSADLGGLVLTALTDARGSFMSYRGAFPGGSDELERFGRSRYRELYAGPAWVLPFRAFLVRSESGVVLIDAGVGPRPGDFLPARQGWLPSSLESAGVSPAEVDVVILTHLHVDHVGWAAVDGSPYFSRARYVASANDWAFFETREESRAVFAEKLEPLERVGALELVELCETIVAPGVVMFPTVGHTPGHMSVRVAGAEAEAVVLGDVAVHPLQLHDPDLAYVHEVDAVVAARTRSSLLEELAAAEVVVAAAHLPNGLGRVVRDGGAFAWEEL